MKDLRRLKELSLYIAEKSMDDLYFGATKLNKILFYAEFHYFAAYALNLTEAKYVHRVKGPVPYEMPIVCDELNRDGSAQIKDVDYLGYTQKRLIPNRPSQIDIFSEKEISFIDAAIEFFRPFNATQLSNWTHELQPWLVTKDGEEIPRYTVFTFHRLNVSEAAVNWGLAELQEIGVI
jgi:uncharacterized phage-associated protein